MFGIIHMDGSGEDNPSLEALPSLYDELHSSGIIEGDVAVIHDDSGWCISAHRDGRLIFGKLGDPKSDRHMIPVEKSKVLQLWKQLINGEIDNLLKEPWKPGYSDSQRSK